MFNSTEVWQQVVAPENRTTTFSHFQINLEDLCSEISPPKELPTNPDHQSRGKQ
jgi:hypothetical protein